MWGRINLIGRCPFRICLNPWTKYQEFCTVGESFFWIHDKLWSIPYWITGDMEFWGLKILKFFWMGGEFQLLTVTAMSFSLVFHKLHLQQKYVLSRNEWVRNTWRHNAFNCYIKGCWFLLKSKCISMKTVIHNWRVAHEYVIEVHVQGCFMILSIINSKSRLWQPPTNPTSFILAW